MRTCPDPARGSRHGCPLEREIRHLAGVWGVSLTAVPTPPGEAAALLEGAGPRATRTHATRARDCTPLERRFGCAY